MSIKEKRPDFVLKHLIKCFYSGCLDFTLKREDAENLTWTKQKVFLKATVQSELLENFPVNCNFTRLFLKKLVAFLEPYQEVHDDTYKFLCFAMENGLRENEHCYRHYIISGDFRNIITLKETNKMVVNGTTGMRTWEAALMLADWALCNKHIFENKKVLELGAGMGFTGITIAKQIDIKSLTLTDCHSEVLQTLGNNVQINFSSFDRVDTSSGTFFKGKERSIEIRSLDWYNIQYFPRELIPEVLIGADLVYDPSIIQTLCNVIEIFLERNSNLEVYISSVIRNEDTYNNFLTDLDSMDVTIDKLSQESIHVDWDNSINRSLLKIKKK